MSISKFPNCTALAFDADVMGVVTSVNPTSTKADAIALIKSG